MTGENPKTLRRFEARDFGAMKSLRADTEAQHLLLAHPKPSVSDEDVASWLAKRSSEQGGLFRVVSDHLDKAVGFVQIADTHGLDRFGWLGICIAREARGQRLGGAAVREAIVLARDELHLRKLLLHVRRDNVAAIRLYDSIGFRNVGLLSRHYDSGTETHDVVIFELLLDHQHVRNV